MAGWRRFQKVQPYLTQLAKLALMFQHLRAQKVLIDPDTFEASHVTVDEARPRGICGPGRMDAAAELLKAGLIDTSGGKQHVKSKRVRDGPQGMRADVP